MKLSEILAKPIKLKGGGTLNIKGFNKHIVDKELGEGKSESESIFNKIFNLSAIPHSSKVVFNDTVVDLPDTPDKKTYYLLYKESDFDGSNVIATFVYSSTPTFDIFTNADKGNTYEIDGESYVIVVGEA